MARSTIDNVREEGPEMEVTTLGINLKKTKRVSASRLRREGGGAQAVWRWGSAGLPRQSATIPINSCHGGLCDRTLLIAGDWEARRPNAAHRPSVREALTRSQRLTRSASRFNLKSDISGGQFKRKLSGKAPSPRFV